MAADRRGLMRHCESVSDLRVQDLRCVLQSQHAIHS
jgi:hypothetical protein